MKKPLSLLLAFLLVLSMAACGSKNNNDAPENDAQTPVELTVFAAASLTESLTAIGEKYMAENANVKLSFNFDSSGKLLTQIKEGAVCDLFISAAPKQMNAMDGSLIGDAEKNPDGLDLIVTDSRINLLENKVTLTVPEGNPKGIERHGHGRVGLEIGQEVLGGILLVPLEHGGGVDDLAAHFLCGVIHRAPA